MKGGERGGDRDQYTQALFQLSGIFITLIAAIISGLFTGLVVRLRIWYHIPNQISWEDTNYYKGAQFALFGKVNNPALRHPTNVEHFFRHIPSTRNMVEAIIITHLTGKPES